jgi:hypothetical protein
MINFLMPAFRVETLEWHNRLRLDLVAGRPKRYRSMNPEPPNHPGNGPNPPGPPDGSGAFTQEIQHSQVTARVPEKVSRGVFSTGAMVFQGAHEFVIDFVLAMAQPNQIAARVVLPVSLMPSVLAALRENLFNYQSKFGPPPALPVPPTPAQPPPIEEIYAQLKLPDDLLSGVYANAVMIAHSPAEFYFDFITNFYPRSAVSCRVYMSAPQVPGLLNTLTRSYHQYQQKLAAGQPPRPPDQGPATP